MVRSGFEAALAPGTVISGKYRVERVLGRGGMGIVVAVRHLDLNQSLAIKVLLPTAATSDEAMTRFVREGRSAAQLTSPHVAKVHDTGHLASGEPYLVMELLNGSDLRAHLSEVGWVPLPKAIAWVLQAAHALAEAHKLNIIHRDIKPANLFLADTSTGQQLKVLDFGVSKQLDVADDLTSTMATVGTPRYMAPEQMRSAKLADTRGDIWSLGVVLYELTTGQHPFQGDSITALCFDVMERTPTPPSEINPALPQAFDEVVARCLEKNPDDRFQSMQELAKALCSIAPDLVRFSGFFDPASLDPVGAVAGVTPMPSVTPDPTGPTKVHPQPPRPSQPRPSQPRPSQPHLSQTGIPSAPDPTDVAMWHFPPGSPPRAALPPLAVRPSLAESPPLALPGHETITSWKANAAPRSDGAPRSYLYAVGGGVALITLSLGVALFAAHRAANAPDAVPAPADSASALAPPTTPPPPDPPPSSNPTAPVVMAVDPPPSSTAPQVAPSSAPSAVASSPKPVMGPSQTGPAYPSMGCYSFNPKNGHKVVNPLCQ